MVKLKVLTGLCSTFVLLVGEKIIKKSFHPECSENCPFQGNWLESDRNLVQVKHNLLNPMADIFVPAYLKKTEYCDKGDKCKNLVVCDKGDNLKFKCDSFCKKFKRIFFLY